MRIAFRSDEETAGDRERYCGPVSEAGGGCTASCCCSRRQCMYILVVWCGVW